MAASPAYLPPSMADDDIVGVVVRAEQITASISLYEIAREDGALLPPIEPGAHVALVLPDGVERSYSLVYAGRNLHSYCVAVKREDGGRGGSRYIHETLKAGVPVTLRPPGNHFPLVEDAGVSVLVAGGIGISPIWSMAQRLEELGRSWVLHYACRSRAEAAFLPALMERPNVVFHFDDEQAGAPIDLVPVIAAAPEGAHVYCCGPLAMLDAFETATAALPRDHVHVEYFTPKEDAALHGGYTVRLARSGREFEVKAGQSLLRALRNNGVDVPYSCEEGICGACEVRILAGRPDHRDMVLTEAEREAGKTLMVCCSGALDPCLTLDL